MVENLFPLFAGSERVRAEKCVNYLNTHLEPRRLNLSQLIRMSARSPEQILREGRVFVAFPCLDLAVTAAELFIQNNIPSKIVSEKRISNSIDITHLFLEIILDGEPFHVETGTKLSLRAGTVSPLRVIRMRLPDGERITGTAARSRERAYTKSHARVPAYKILGFSSRFALAKHIGRSIPRIVRLVAGYNRLPLAYRLEKRAARRTKKNPPRAH